MPALSLDESVVNVAKLDLAALMWKLLHYFVIFIFGALGCVIFGIVGSMAWPGAGAIIGAITGLLIFAIIGCFVSRLLPGYNDVFSPERMHKGWHAGDILPHSAAKYMTDGKAHGAFTLDVTVRMAHQVTIGGMMAVVRSAPYVEVHCGSNPVKRTCVDPNMQWNETFRLKISPHDEMIKLILFNQDLFGEKVLGQVTMELEHDVMPRLMHECVCNKEPGDKADFNYKCPKNDPPELCRPHKFRIERGGSNSIISKTPTLEVAFFEVPHQYEESLFPKQKEISPDWTTTAYRQTAYGTLP